MINDVGKRDRLIAFTKKINVTYKLSLILIAVEIADMRQSFLRDHMVERDQRRDIGKLVD